LIKNIHIMRSVALALTAIAAPQAVLAQGESSAATSRILLGANSPLPQRSEERKALHEALMVEYDFIVKHPEAVTDEHRFVVFDRVMGDLRRNPRATTSEARRKQLEQDSATYKQLEAGFKSLNAANAGANLAAQATQKAFIAGAQSIVASGQYVGLLIDLGEYQQARAVLWQVQKDAKALDLGGADKPDALQAVPVMLALLDAELAECEGHEREAEDIYKANLPEPMPKDVVGGKISSKDAERFYNASKDDTQIGADVIELYAAFLVKHRRYGDARKLLLDYLVPRKAIDSIFYIPAVDDADTFHSNWDIANALRDLGYARDAKAYYLKAASRAQTAEDKKRIGQAVAARVPRHIPEQAVQDLYARAYRADMRGNKEVALDIFLDCLEQDPDFEWVWRKVAKYRLEKGDLTEAQKCLDKALSLNPSYARAWVDLARLQIARKERQEACKSALKAIDLDPEDIYVINVARSILREAES
jgi:tetratricopeptide (TPR) repeat protein